MKKLLFLFLVSIAFISCKDDEPDPSVEGPYLKFKFKFDNTQERLGIFGQPSTIPTGNAAQHPDFNAMSAHFIELVKTNLTPYQDGAEAYMGQETNAGGANAIDFQNAIVKDEGEVWHQIPLSNIEPGTYKHLRVSVAYQNYDVKYNILNVPVIGDVLNQSGTVASFVGFNTFITDLKPKNLEEAVNDDKLQGFWAFETNLDSPLDQYNRITTGQAPNTTVVNPFNVQIPVGSCVVGGNLSEPLEVTGNETEDVTITLSFSANNSFEWIDQNGNGKWDMDATDLTVEPVVDMGLRGLIGIVE